MKKIYLILGLIFLTLSCMGPGKFTIDNPTDKAISIKLDGKEYKLEPQKYEDVKLKAGDHSLILEDGKEVKFEVLKNSKGGVINPTKSDYVYVSIAYVVKGKSGYIPQDKVIEIEGIQYQGPYEKINDLIIDKNMKIWAYGIHTPFPEEVKLKNSNSTVKVKLYSKKEFIDFIESVTGTQGFHEQNKVITEEEQEPKKETKKDSAPENNKLRGVIIKTEE